MGKSNRKQRDEKGEVDIMAVSIKPAPVFKGQAAKDLLCKVENPTSKKELLAKCEELGKIFKEK